MVARDKWVVREILVKWGQPVKWELEEKREKQVQKVKQVT